MKLRPIEAFRPIQIPDSTRVLSNAQIAQIMVRGSEIICDQHTIFSILKTLTAVRDLRNSVINSKELNKLENLVEKINSTIGLQDHDLYDCDFD